MGEIIQLRDFQNPKDIERMQRELEKEAAATLGACGPCESATLTIADVPPYGGKGIDGMDLGKEPA